MRSPRIALTGPARWLALVACLVPVVLGFLLPAGYLAREVIAARPAASASIRTSSGMPSPPWRSPPCATAIVLVLGFAAVAALRYVRHPVVAACVNVAGIGYAMPGTVLALGLLSPLVAGRRGHQLPSRARFGGAGVGLVLAGSSAALVIAYVIRFLAIAIGFAQAGFARISPEFDDVARMLGAGPATLVAHDPSAAAAAGDLGRGAAGVRRLPQGAAGDAAAAAAQCRDALDLHLSVRDPRQLRGGRARRPDHRRWSASCRSSA